MLAINQLHKGLLLTLASLAVLVGIRGLQFGLSRYAHVLVLLAFGYAFDQAVNRTYYRLPDTLAFAGPAVGVLVAYVLWNALGDSFRLVCDGYFALFVSILVPTFLLTAFRIEWPEIDGQGPHGGAPPMP